MLHRNDRTAKPAQTVKPHSSPQNRIPLTFDQAVEALLAVDPKKLPHAVRPSTSKANKKAAKQRAAAKKKG
jgi:hypothetical protein